MVEAENKTFFVRYCYFQNTELGLAYCWPWVSLSAKGCWDQCSRSCSRIALAVASLCLKSFPGTGPAHLAFLVEAYQRWCCFPPLSCSRLTNCSLRQRYPHPSTSFQCRFLRELIFILLPDGWFTRAVENIHSLSKHVLGLETSLQENKHFFFSLQSFKQGW